jgi:hypothetical protein
MPELGMSITKDLELPRSRECRPVRDPDRVYEINGTESRMLATVGSFRVVSGRHGSMPGWNDTRRTFKIVRASVTRRTERCREPASDDDGTRSRARFGARGDIEARDRGSYGSDARCGTCPRTWTSLFTRAQLTRSRIPRLMMVRSSGSCAYESLETRSAVLDRLHRRRPTV